MSFLADHILLHAVRLAITTTAELFFITTSVCQLNEKHDDYELATFDDSANCEM